MNNNAYHNASTDQLLRLKRQESDSLLDIVRVINSNYTPEQMTRVAALTLVGQLGIGKLGLYLAKEPVLALTFTKALRDDTNIHLELLQLGPAIHRPVPVRKDHQPFLYQAGIEYVICLQGNSRTEGYLLVGDFAQSEQELQNDLIFMQTVAGMLAMALENRRLFEEHVAQASLKRELALAESIQQLLLPAVFDTPKGLSVEARNIPHQQIGGDFYDLIPCGKNAYIFCMADVAGKSISAALVMAVVQASLRALSRYARSLEDMIQELHEELFALNKGEKFVTLFLGKIDLTTQTLTYINAGHNPPLLKSGDQIKELTEGCIPLGIMSIEKPQTGNLILQTGDLIFLYTDGVTEQENPLGEMFGMEALKDWLLNCQSYHLTDSLIEELKRFSHEKPASDDISVMSVRIGEAV
jgi:sigma-B regulation protein RsbU (phosphoserine phosphatase)